MDGQAAVHLGFLTDAAHMLLTSAPETSAYLLGRRNDLAWSNSIELTDVQRQHACAACGHIMIPGDSSELTPVISKRSKQKRHRRSSRGSTSVTSTSITTPLRKKLECGLCHEVTIIELPLPPVIGRQKRETPGSLPAAVTRAVPVPASTQKGTPTANASSKKRAKNRKAGLQALLQQSSQGSRSLSLADFSRK